MGATTLDIIPQRQKCHNKPFSLVYHQSHKEKSVKGGRKTAEFTLDALFCWLSCRRGKRLSVRSVTSPCASLSVPAEESKGWSATIFYLLHSLIGKPKLILQIKNKPLTVSLLHFQSRPRGSKLHCISGEIHARIYPLDKWLSLCYIMCSGYIASSLKCYHFRTCEGGKPPFNPPFQRAERLIV